MSILSFVRSLFASPPSRRRYDYAVGFGLTTVKGHSPLTVSVHPDVAFRPERLVIPATVAAHFQVLGVKVGAREQLRSVGAVPAAAFDERSTGPCLGMDVARPSDFLSVEVVNVSGDEQVFQCGLVGPVV